MKKIICLFICLFIAINLAAKIENSTGKMKFSLILKNSYDFDSGLNSTQFTLELPHKSLLFERDGDKYTAEFKVKIVCYKEEEQIFGRFFSESLEVEQGKYEEFRQEFFTKTYSTNLPDGYIGYIFEVTDRHSNSMGRVASGFENETKEGQETFLSEIELVNIADSTLVFSGDEINADGLVSVSSFRDLSKDSDFYLFFEVFKPAEKEYTIEYSIINSFQKNDYEAVEEYTFEKDRNTVLYRIPINSLSRTSYMISVRLLDKSGEVMDEKEVKMMLHYSHLFNLDNIELLLRQIKIIATPGEIDYIEDGATEEEVLARIIQYWDERDPIRETPENELLEEFYYRIDLANQMFSSIIHKHGWATDRGKVLVKNGQPDEIIDKPFESEYKPYIIWVYHKLNRKYYFIDRDGYGDYMLEYVE